MRFHQAAAVVWDEAASNSPSTPKLSLFSLPSGVKGSLRHSPAPPPPTPPINTLVSVPFKWEEAPGKPRPRRLDRHYDDHHDPSKNTDPIPPAAARCLELPPRLVVSSSSNNRRVSNIPSPACTSFRQEEEEDGSGGGRGLAKRSMSFTNYYECGRSPPGGGSSSSRRWGEYLVMKMAPTRVRKIKDQQVANLDSSTEMMSADDRSGDALQQRNVKITRIRRRRSLFNLSAAASRPQACLNSMYKSFKKIVMASK